MSPSLHLLESNKFCIVLHELFHPTHHGFDDDSDPNVIGHFLVHSSYQAFRLIEDGVILPDVTMDDIEEHYYQYLRSREPVLQHPVVRNYRSIIMNEKFMRPEIAQCITLSGGECVAILKTIWLRLIQRTWKKIYKERQRILLLRCRPESLKYIQIYGKWSQECCFMPSLKGMMTYLK